MTAAGPYRIFLVFPLTLRPFFPTWTLLLILFQPHGILPIPSNTRCVFLQVLHLLFPLPEVSSPVRAHFLSSFDHELKIKVFTAHSIYKPNFFQLLSLLLHSLFTSPAFLFLDSGSKFLISLWSISSHQKAGSTGKEILSILLFRGKKICSLELRTLLGS